MHFYCVIGANYGDEGKGLVTDYLANKIINEDKDNCLVLLNNGGAQRGHTVIRNGRRHVFHHFGSGTMVGATTYITCNFITNPLIFIKEYHELEDLDIKPSVYISDSSEVTTPFDMIANQIISKFCGRYDTCGVGVWQTIQRMDTHDFGWYSKNLEIEYKDYMKKRSETLLQDIITYLETQPSNRRPDLHGIEEFYRYYMREIDIEGLIDHFKSDLAETIKISNNHFIKFSDELDFGRQCSGMFMNAIIENGQGLLLDWYWDTEYGTPSRTGAQGAYMYLGTVFRSKVKYSTFDLCYVSRSYLTRHGDGKFPEEVDEIYYNDHTNVENPNQGKLRFGKLNYNELLDRVNTDTKAFRYPHNTHLYITHSQLFQHKEGPRGNIKEVHYLPFND